MPEPIAEFIADVHAAEDTTLTGKLDFLEALVPVLARWGAPDKGQALRQWLTLVAVDHEVLGLVARLRQAGYACVLATNQQPHRARFMADDLGYRTKFDHCFFSCEMGVAKPDPRYFHAILKTLNLAPDQALFLDDKPQNIAGARSVGIQAECFANAKDGRAHAALTKILARFGVVCQT